MLHTLYLKRLQLETLLCLIEWMSPMHAMKDTHFCIHKTLPWVVYTLHRQKVNVTIPSVKMPFLLKPYGRVLMILLHLFVHPVSITHRGLPSSQVPHNGSVPLLVSSSSFLLRISVRFWSLNSFRQSPVIDPEMTIEFKHTHNNTTTNITVAVVGQTNPTQLPCLFSSV